MWQEAQEQSPADVGSEEVGDAEEFPSREERDSDVTRAVPGPPPESGGEDSEQNAEKGARRDERSRRHPLRSAVERLRRARARKQAVKEEMETEKSASGLFQSSGEEVPANPTWRELLEECEAEVEAARKELHRQVEHHEVDRSA